MHEKRITDFAGFSKWLNLGIPGIFRGHSDADWPLQSSISRYFDSTSLDKDYWITEEYYSIREFQRKAPFYAQRLPESEDWVSWMAMIQHHGGRTRLVDFTYSRYVAAYFAAADAASDFAVWNITDPWIRDIATHQISGDLNSLREDSLQQQHLAANSFIKSLFSDHRGGNTTYDTIEGGIFMLEPIWSTQRQSIQQGLFLMPRDIHKGFLDNISCSIQKAEDDFYKNEHITKYIFSHSLRGIILSTLKEMNVTSETLYGGLDGLARSVLKF